MRQITFIYTVRIYHLEISVPVSESLFFYSAYEADKSKRIPKYTFAATKYFYISLILSTSTMFSGYATDICIPI